MQFDSSISMDLVVSLLAIFAAVWKIMTHIDSKVSALRDELKKDNENLREEMKADNVALREEMKADNVALREEMVNGDAALRRDMKELNQKVDAGNQRLARLEGVIL